jgi:hypothetical protein
MPLIKPITWIRVHDLGSTKKGLRTSNTRIQTPTRTHPHTQTRTQTHTHTHALTNHISYFTTFEERSREIVASKS